MDCIINNPISKRIFCRNNPSDEMDCMNSASGLFENNPKLIGLFVK